jgi:sugar phosphate isomerase/epimerase
MQTWIRSEPLERTARRLARHGFDSLELGIGSQRLELGEARRVLRASGITCWAVVTALETPWNLVAANEADRTAAVAYVTDCIHIARELEAPVVTVVPAADGPVPPPGVSSAEQWRWAVDGLRYCAAEAERAGIVLAIEPLNRYETYFVFRADQALALAQECGPACGVALDVFHLNIEEADPFASIVATGARLADFHVSDTNRLACGSGHWDWTRTIGALRQAGYDGALTVEFVPARSRISLPLATAAEERAVLGRSDDSLSEDLFDALVERSARTLRPLIMSSTSVTKESAGARTS